MNRALGLPTNAFRSRFAAAVLGQSIVWSLLAASWSSALGADSPRIVRSEQSGLWSAKTTWERGVIPGSGDKVQIRTGHSVVYDVNSKDVIRLVHVAGKLSFARDRDTRLDVGLLKIQAGDDLSEEGFDCEAHLPEANPNAPRPALEVGSADRPIQADRTATIRLVLIDGHDPKSCPAIVCCGGRMDFHGSPLSRTWVKLGAPVNAKDSDITLAEAVTGWRVGDRVILTATTRQNKIKKTFRESVRDSTQTEERIIRAIDGAKLTFDRPLEFNALEAHAQDAAGHVEQLPHKVSLAHEPSFSTTSK